MAATTVHPPGQRNLCFSFCQKNLFILASVAVAAAADTLAEGKGVKKAETAKRKHWKLPLSDLPVYVLLSQYVLLQEHARYIRVLLSCDQKDAFYLLVTQDLGGLGRTLPHIPYSQYLPVSLFSFTERETFRC